MDAFLDSKESTIKKSDEAIAWENKDWSALDDILDKTKHKQDNKFFAVLNSINYDKLDLDIETFYPEYSQFMVNLALSHHVDIIKIIEYVNIYGKELTPQMHYNFLKQMIPKKKRFGKWPKLDENIEDKFINRLIQEVYTVSHQSAVRYKFIMISGNMLNSFIASNLSYLKNETFMLKVCKSKAEIRKLEKAISEKYQIK